ncbi:unnamed protein product, partial [marine sediment metagenome]
KAEAINIELPVSVELQVKMSGLYRFTELMVIRVTNMVCLKAQFMPPQVGYQPG